MTIEKLYKQMIKKRKKKKQNEIQIEIIAN